MSETASLRGFGPVGIVVIAIVLLTGNIVLPNFIVIPVGAMLVLAWTEMSGTAWEEIGYVRPANWPRAVAVGIALGVTLKIVLKYLVMPLLGAPRVNQAYHFLAGNTAILPAAIIGMCIVGFAEETVFRGFLFERLGKLLGTSTTAKIAIVLITSVMFAAAHYAGQGLAGVEQATMTGLAFGTVFAMSRSIVTPMIAHAAYDLTALAIIYLRLE